MADRGICMLVVFLLSPALAVAQEAARVPTEKDPLIVYGVQLEQLEYRLGDTDMLVWDGDAIIGTFDWKLRLQSEGEYDLDAGQLEIAENQFLVQHRVSDFFDIKGGARFDTRNGPDRVYAVLGVQGLAKQWFEVDLDLFLSNELDLSTRLDAEYEILITNRLILIPSVEVDFAFSDDREIGVGTGFSGVEAGLRLSYDLVDRLASPYIGVSYERSFGETSVIRQAEGEDPGELFFVAGVRVMF